MSETTPLLGPGLCAVGYALSAVLGIADRVRSSLPGKDGLAVDEEGSTAWWDGRAQEKKQRITI